MYGARLDFHPTETQAGQSIFPRQFLLLFEEPRISKLSGDCFSPIANIVRTPTVKEQNHIVKKSFLY